MNYAVTIFIFQSWVDTLEGNIKLGNCSKQSDCDIDLRNYLNNIQYKQINKNKLEK